MFDGCAKITSLIINNFDTHRLKEIKYMFNGCLKLVDLEVGKDFVINGIKDLSGLFSDCLYLTKINTVIHVYIQI